MPLIGSHMNGRLAASFPDVEEAPPDGFLAWGGNLEPETLVSAYSKGIFPWYSEGDPILWWSPDPRCVLLPDDFHISARSRRKIKNSHFYWSVDCAFADVLAGCAAPRRDGAGTWLLPEMIEAYTSLHELNIAHSVEIWAAGELAGGAYGVALGHAFFGESMFRRANEASRAAICCLVKLLKQNNFIFLDCQQASPHMLAMGACEMPRKSFLALLKTALDLPPASGRSWQRGPELCGP